MEVAIGRIGSFGDLGTAVVEPEIVEIDVSPASRVVIHQTDENLVSQVRGQIKRDPLHVLNIVARRLGDHQTVIGPNDLGAGGRKRPGSDQKAGERF